MPLLDLPLDKLYTYEGRNPKPNDFDRFWDRSLAEMEALDPQVRLERIDLGVSAYECFRLWFKGTHGAEVHAKYVRPKGARNRPAILQFHGYTWHSGEWSDRFGLAGEGYCVAALDCRGQSGLSTDPGGNVGNTHNGQIIRGVEGPPENMYFRNVFLDTAMLAKVVAQFDEVDPERIGAMGGSQGGGLTLACSALSNIKMAAPMYPFLCDYRRVWEMDLAKGAYAEIRDHLRRRHPNHTEAEAFWTKLGYIDNQHLAPRIKAKTLMAVGLMDDICPPSTQFAAFNKITAEKEALIYPDFGHEGLPGWNDRLYRFFSEL